MMKKVKAKITPEQREEITRRVLAGEKAAALGEEFGVTRAYVSLLKMQALEPERFRLKQEAKLTRKLTPAEIETFKDALSSGTPESHGLIPAIERWNHNHGHQLAWKMFRKKVSPRMIKELMGPYIVRWEDIQDERPKPPKPHHINQIDPELAKDKDYVAYYLSPICQQIAQKEYEMRLAHWEERFGEKKKQEEAARDGAGSKEPEPLRQIAPGQRFGKHSKSKGSPFTPPKKRRKKRR